MKEGVSLEAGGIMAAIKAGIVTTDCISTASAVCSIRLFHLVSSS